MTVSKLIMTKLLLVNAVTPQNQASGGSEVSEQWSAFKAQPNLAPIHLDQGVSHLEVSKFIDSMRTNITAGFRGVIPRTGVDLCSSIPEFKLVGEHEK